MATAQVSSTPKEVAKTIILEIIQQAGGRLENTTNLFKAFWRAHVNFSESHLAYLSRWPIVRMPQGPGIHHFDVLLGEMMVDGLISTSTVQKGPYSAICFELCGPFDGASAGLSPSQIEAIKHGVACVVGKTAKQVSAESHKDSRMWNALEDGNEIDVCLDLVSDSEHLRRKTGLSAISSEIDRVLKTSSF